MPSFRFLKGAWLAPALLAAAIPAGAAAAVPGAGHEFGGLTSQTLFGIKGEPAELLVGGTGKRIARATASLHLRCTPSTQVVDVPDRYTRIPLHKDRSFRASFAATAPGDSGGTIRSFGSMHGRFNRGWTKASGTWSLTLVFKDATGTTTDTCRSGKVKWSVKR